MAQNDISMTDMSLMPGTYTAARIILVTSCKGGVGKSTCAANLGIEIKTICHGYIETIFPHENGLYGFAAQAAWKMTSIPTSCNQYIVEKRRKVPARAEQ